MTIDVIFSSGVAVIFLVVKWVLIIIVSLVVIGAIRSAIENKQSHFQETSRKISAEEERETSVGRKRRLSVCAMASDAVRSSRPNSLYGRHRGGLDDAGPGSRVELELRSQPDIEC